MTNHHVVVGARKLTVCFRDGTSKEARAYAAADAEKDVAVICVETTKKAPALELSARLPSPGQKVVTMSYFERNPGEVTRVSDNEVTMIEATARACRGFSGGPLVNYAGEVLGINSQHVSGSECLLAVASKDIWELLRSSRNSGHPLPVLGGDIQVALIADRVPAMLFRMVSYPHDLLQR